MKFTNANKNSSIMEATKKINKANYIIGFELLDVVFGLVTKYIFISNKKSLKQVVNKYNIDKNLSIYGWENKKYNIYKLNWCI